MNRRRRALSWFVSIAIVPMSAPTMYVNESPGNILAGCQLNIKNASKHIIIIAVITAYTLNPSTCQARKPSVERIMIPMPASKPL